MMAAIMSQAYITYSEDTKITRRQHNPTTIPPLQLPFSDEIAVIDSVVPGLLLAVLGPADLGPLQREEADEPNDKESRSSSLHGLSPHTNGQAKTEADNHSQFSTDDYDTFKVATRRTHISPSKEQLEILHAKNKALTEFLRPHMQGFTMDTEME